MAEAAMKATVLGKQAKADLPTEIFGEPFHEALVHEAARADLAARRGHPLHPDPRRGVDDDRQGLAPEGHRPRPRGRPQRPAPLRRRRRLRPEAAPLHGQGQPQGAPEGAARRAQRPRRAGQRRRPRRLHLQRARRPSRPRARCRSGARSRRPWSSSPPRRRPRRRASATSTASRSLEAGAAGVADVIGATSLVVSEAALEELQGEGGLMDARQVIIRPVVSEKSYALIAEGKYTFRVDDRAHKTADRQRGRGDLRRQRAPRCAPPR